MISWALAMIAIKTGDSALGAFIPITGLFDIMIIMIIVSVLGGKKK